MVLIHHLGKDSSKGARGHSSLKAAADAEITVEKRGGIRTAAVTKMKDGEQGLEMPFRLITVELGKDEDGEPITSCVIEHVEGAQEAHSERKPAGAKQRLIWEVANELAALAGEEELTVDDVLSLAKERIPYDPQSGKRDQRRAHAIRALEGLQSDGWLRIEGGQVVLCKK